MFQDKLKQIRHVSDVYHGVCKGFIQNESNFNKFQKFFKNRLQF